MAAAGEIVPARFPFTDQSAAKIRPVLVLAEVPGAYRDFVVMFVSSQVSRAVGGLDLTIDPSHRAFGASGLKVASVFRVGKIATLSESLILGGLGALDWTTFGELVRRLVGLLSGGTDVASPKA